MQSPTRIQRAAQLVDLKAALKGGTERNDLLPPRLEDNVTGEVGKRFSEGLALRIERGTYDPTPAVFIEVPKPGFTTRLAALLTLPDRIAYEALVAALRPRIEKAMVGDAIAYWPRGIAAEKKWRRFESECLEANPSYIALADVTAFYESIDHETLRETLVDLTGQREVVEALAEFLNRVMRSHKGIPQGLAASDALATAYLTPLDHSMTRDFLEYRRHGDDFRLSSMTFPEARESLLILERSLRRRGLLLSANKARVTKAATYQSHLDAGDRIIEETRKDLLKDKIHDLKDNDEAIAKLIEEVGQEDLGWQFFYHGSLTFEEMANQLAGHLSASDVDISSAMFREAMKRKPGTKRALTSDEFHHRVTSSLVRLAAAKSDTAIDSVGDLSAVAPDKTESIAGYLLAQPLTRGARVVKVLIGSLDEGVFRTGWEIAWLLRSLEKFAAKITKRKLELVHAIAIDENADLLARVEAMKVLGKRGQCDRLLMRRLWNTGPIVFRTDLVAAAYHAKSKQPWCATFLDGAKDDPIINVALKHLAKIPQKDDGGD